MRRCIVSLAAPILAAFLLAACKSTNSLPDYGISYRIDAAEALSGAVKVTYSVQNSGDKEINNLELLITVIDDSGSYWAGLTPKINLGTESTATMSLEIEVSGTFTPSYASGTGTLSNVFVSGAWWDS